MVAALYGPLLRRQGGCRGSSSRSAELKADNAKVRQLSAALDSVESRYAQVRQMIGGDIVRDPLTVGTALPVAPAVVARLAEPRAGPRSGCPFHVDGRWTSRDTSPAARSSSGASDEVHPGIDIAVAVGSLVRAAGGGTVHQLGEDPEYGLVRAARSSG